MECFKLTGRHLDTYNGFLYTFGVWTPKLGGIGKLCSASWYHVYDHPLVAAMFNPMHANIKRPRLFEASYDGRMATFDDNGTKRGVARLRLVKEIPLPALTATQRVRFAIYCARRVYDSGAWTLWSNAWLDGTDRSASTADRLVIDCRRNAGGACDAASFATRTVGEPHNMAYCAARAAESIIPLTVRSPGVNIWVDTIKRAIKDENKFQEEKTACGASS